MGSDPNGRKGWPVSKYRLFGTAGAVAGFTAAALYTVWESSLQGAPPNWGIGALAVSATYVVAVGVLVACVVLALSIAQNLYLAQENAAGSLIVKGATAALYGVIAGFLAPLIAYKLAEADIGRFFAWTLSGAFAGVIVSKAVVNMRADAGIIGGAAGGLLGCIILYQSGQNLFLGFAATGLLIGALLAYSERSSRTHWLLVELRHDCGVQKTIEVSLGATPISIGAAKGTDIRLDAIHRADAQISVTIAIVEGQIVMNDHQIGAKNVLSAGQQLRLSNALITVKSK
jgi:hypothetical protein